LLYLSTDELLALALPLVYLANSVVLLERGEVALVLAAGRLRRVDLGSDFLLAGRRPAIANPLTPYRAAFRGTWSVTEPERADDAIRALQDVARALRPVSVLSSIAAGAAVIGAPVALLLARPGLFLVFWAICVSTSIASGCIALARRSTLSLSRGSILWMSLLAAVCIPFAGALARTFASHLQPRIRLPEFAKQHLSVTCWTGFRERFVGLLQRYRLHAEDGSAEAAQIDQVVRTLGEQVA
jgi:hypothetical protein